MHTSTSGNQRRNNCSTTPRADAGNMLWRRERALSVGRTSSSSTKILVVRAAAPPGPASSVCLRQSAPVPRARCLRSRLRGWLAMAECLAAQARLEERMENLRHEQPRMLSEDERAMLLALADDLPRVWNHPDASIEIRKRILRAVLMEIVVTIEGDRLRLVVHWQGGDHTRLEVVKN